eukprot:273170-Hanusia_phi.AAC.1
MIRLHKSSKLPPPDLKFVTVKTRPGGKDIHPGYPTSGVPLHTWHALRGGTRGYSKGNSMGGGGKARPMTTTLPKTKAHRGAPHIQGVGVAGVGAQSSQTPWFDP